MSEHVWKRPAPARSKPQRQLAANVSLTGSRKPNGTGRQASGAAKGAQLGYAVSEEQMSEGKAQARFYDIPGAGSDLFGAGFADLMGSAQSENFLALSERLMRDTLLWVEFVARSVQWQGLGKSTGSGGDVSGEKTTAAAENSGFIGEISSLHPVELTFQPQPGAASKTLGVHDLRAMDPEAPPITDVKVTREGEHWRIRVNIDSEQQVGLYTGIVFDCNDGSIQGSLAVSVKDN